MSKQAVQSVRCQEAEPATETSRQAGRKSVLTINKVRKQGDVLILSPAGFIRNEWNLHRLGCTYLLTERDEAALSCEKVQRVVPRMTSFEPTGY